MANHDKPGITNFKARYFPHSEFFDAKVGHNPSFVWRSICNSKFILRAGTRWRIGSGTDISLLNENWLFDASALNVQDIRVTLAANLSVADIIMPDQKNWNLPLISSLFEPSIVLKIVKTPLYNSVTEDKRIRHKEKDGMYSVKSAYRLCVQEQLDTSHLKMSGNWKLIWNLKVPPRVKNLIWRICRQCIPTRTNLHHRGVNCTTAYMACIICSIWQQRNNQVWNDVTDAQSAVFARAVTTLND